MDILDRFAGTLNPEETQILTHVRQFIEWHVGSGKEFVPGSHDDVAWRTYLMEMKMNGVGVKDQREQMASLRRFYDWAESAGYLSDDHPFEPIGVQHLRWQAISTIFSHSRRVAGESSWGMSPTRAPRRPCIWQ